MIATYGGTGVSSCGDGNVLKWSSVQNKWVCGADVGGGAGGITGNGTTNNIPLWNTSSTLADSRIKQDNATTTIDINANGIIRGALCVAGGLTIGGCSGGGIVGGGGGSADTNWQTSWTVFDTNMKNTYLQTTTKPLTVPTITGQAGKYLSTDGTTLSWSTPIGGGGGVTSISQSNGITLSTNPITTTGSVAIDPTYTQRRVSGTCATGAIQTINQDGTVTCDTPGVTSINGVTGPAITLAATGTGLTITQSGSTITFASNPTGKYSYAMNTGAPIGGQYCTIAVYGGNLWVSTDWCQTFTSKGLIRNWVGVVISANGQGQMAIDSTGNVYVSTDSGSTWGLKKTVS